MKPGKLASQVAHAARMSLLRYLSQFEDPQLIAEAINGFLEVGSCGSVSVTEAKKSRQSEQVLKAVAGARDAGLPTAAFIDSGHIDLPHFDGSPVLTAVAIGPSLKEQNRPFSKKFQSVK